MSDLHYNPNIEKAYLLSLELRHLEASKLTKLSSIIDTTQGWRKLLDVLTRDCLESLGNSKSLTKLSLTLDNINLIEQQLQCGKSPSLALLNYWSITGRRRPTLGTLLAYLRLCNLGWAEHFVCQSIIGVQSIEDIFPQPQRTPNQSENIRANPRRSIDTRFKFDQKLAEALSEIGSRCPRYSFEDVFRSTNHFCDKPYDAKSQSGTKIGEGRFSSVYRAHVRLLGADDEPRIVAAKLLQSDCDINFISKEIKLMAGISYENVLELLGISLGKENAISTDHQYISLIYPYMENGSLLECLSQGLLLDDMRHLNWIERLNIAKKVARGINNLHSHKSGPIVHRDIKTANIFLDRNLEPKIGDFTLVHQLKSCHDTATQDHHPAIGTSAYMAPEVFRGVISTKSDTFSFGIVSFELLTGLKPFLTDLNEDILTHLTKELDQIDEKFDQSDQEGIEKARDGYIRSVLDFKAGKWDFPRSKSMFTLALEATADRKRNRPEMSAILAAFESIALTG